MATKAAARTTGRLRAIQAALSPKEWAKVGVMAGVVLGLNVLGWAMLVAATGHHYHLSKTAVFGFGTGVLAYTLGMRHAFDADHISAIDNTTRKLMAEGKRPLSVGFFFSLGHSTIVFCPGRAAQLRHPRRWTARSSTAASGLHECDQLVGTSVSGFFLYLIAGLNLVILVAILRVFGDLRRGDLRRRGARRAAKQAGPHEPASSAASPARSTPPGRCTRSGCCSGWASTRRPRSRCWSWPARRWSSGLPFYAILSLPILFAAGMCLFDTLDGCFMNFAYGLGLRQADPQGVLQHHHHRPFGLRRLRHRDDRGRRAVATGVPPARPFLGRRWRISTSTGPGSSSSPVRRHLDCRLGDLALRPHRVALGPVSGPRPLREGARP